MGREQKRAAKRQADKLERELQRTANRPTAKAPQAASSNGVLEASDEAARRIYRTGSKPEPRAKAARRVVEKPRKWREGRL